MTDFKALSTESHGFILKAVHIAFLYCILYTVYSFKYINQRHIKKDHTHKDISCAYTLTSRTIDDGFQNQTEGTPLNGGEYMAAWLLMTSNDMKDDVLRFAYVN